MAGAAQARVLLFAKAPVPGRVKTRLVPALGPQGAADLAARLLRHSAAEALTAGIGAVELVADPAPDHPSWTGHLPDGLAVSEQTEGELGNRLAAAASPVAARGEPVILIGADCPALTAPRIREAAAALATHDASIIPATDGGYVLLGLSRFDPTIFRDIAWSTDQVLAQTLDRIAELGWSVLVGDPLPDVDEAADLIHLPGSWRHGLPHASAGPTTGA